MAECEHLARTSAYFDGALGSGDEAAAASHLAGCRECQALLGDAVGLDVALSAVTLRRRRRWPLIAAGAVALAVAGWLLWPYRAHPVATVALELPQERVLEPRFSAVQFAVHRPFSALRSEAHAREAITLAAMAELEHRGDVHALVAALAATDDRGRAEKLAATLPDDAASDSDRAAVALTTGDLDRAVRFSRRALERDPRSNAAAWNLGLAARALGLPRVARAAFMRVVAAGEPGWNAEATRDVATLDHDLAIENGYAAFDLRAKAMIAGGDVITADDASNYPARARIAFYDAARLAPDRARLAALRPLATALDLASGQPTCAAALDRIDPALGARFAARYRAAIDYTATPAQITSLLDELRRAGHGADDLRLGTIILAGRSGELLAELEPMIAPWHDPWFAFYIARERIRHDLPKHDLRGIQRLSELATGCTQDAWAQRCGMIMQDLAELELATGRYEAAQTHAVAAADWQRRGANRSLLLAARALVAEVHRLRGLSDRARAEFEELALAAGDRDCDLTRYAQIGQTEVAIALHDWASARASLPPATPPVGCSEPADLVGVAAAVDLARLSGDATDHSVAEQWVAAAPGLAEGGAALIGKVRMTPGSDSAAAKAWIDAHATSTDPVIAGVRAWGITTLVDDAARRGAWAEMFVLARAPAARCRVVASADDGTLAVAIETPAGLDGEHRLLTADLASTQIIADRLVARLRDCAEIAVVARPPLHGRSDLLPVELPWSFAGDGPPHAAVPGHQALEVSDARPPDPQFVRLARRSDLAFDTRLTGDAATPARVLAALATATYVELDVHGVVSSSDGDAAWLALSPDADGRFTLRADTVKAAHFNAAPLVVLAACHGAVVAPYLRERWSLPDAFVTAGARAVVAVDVAIPDADAGTVFDDLHRRVDAGATAAVAVAAIRAAAPAGSWARRLVVFQ